MPGPNRSSTSQWLGLEGGGFRGALSRYHPTHILDLILFEFLSLFLCTFRSVHISVQHSEVSGREGPHPPRPGQDHRHLDPSDGQSRPDSAAAAPASGPVPCIGCVCANSLQSCLTLCDRVDCSPPGSSAYRILQERLLEWVAMPSSRASFRLRYWTYVS